MIPKKYRGTPRGPLFPMSEERRQTQRLYPHTGRVKSHRTPIPKAIPAITRAISFILNTSRRTFGTVITAPPYSSTRPDPGLSCPARKCTRKKMCSSAPARPIQRTYQRGSRRWPPRPPPPKPPRPRPPPPPPNPPRLSGFGLASLTVRLRPSTENSFSSLMAF